MASISDFTSHFALYPDFQEILPYVVDESEFVLPSVESYPFEDGGFDAVSSKTTETGHSDFCKSFPDRFGVTEANLAGAVVPEFEMNSGEMVQMQSPPSIGCCQAAHEFVEENGAFKSDFWPVYCGNGDVWEVHRNSLPRSGEPVLKVARYTVEERKNRILKYLKKRNQRNFNKTIKYACRKTLADRRRRVRGRFASNSENRREEEEYHKNGAQVPYPPEHDEHGSSACISGAKVQSCKLGLLGPTWTDPEQNFPSMEDPRHQSWAFFQTKDNMEEWYEDAVRSLMYLPITAG